ncbi:MAG: aspartate ammonia-lyase, partial [Bacteroidetes bacterium]
MQKKREEYDLLGQREMDADALYGIHSLRAKENFPARELFHPEWYKSVGIVKVAVYQTIERFRGALISKYQRETFPFYLPSQQVLEALQAAALYVAEGNGYSHMIVPALTGGGGTSQHMNVNEIITNRALLSLGSERGNYKMIDPFEDANIFQSTNDVMPTALHVAVMRRLKHLEKAINQLRAEVEKKESR